MCCHNTLLKTSGSNKTKGSSTDVFLTFQPWEKKKSAELCSVTPPPKMVRGRWISEREEIGKWGHE